jgi:hypothetical protein
MFIYSPNLDGSPFYYDKDGVQRQIAMPAGNIDYVNVQAVTDDGRIWVGGAWDPVAWKWIALKWVDGVPNILPEPANNIQGNPLTNGVLPRGCSADGSVIYGQDMFTWGIVIWKNDNLVGYIGEGDDNIYRWHYITVINLFGMEVQSYVLDAPQVLYHPFRLSPNGKYLSFNYSKIISNEQKRRTEVLYGGFMNLETGAITILDDVNGFEPMSSRTACDDGTLFYRNAASSLNETGLVYHADYGTGGTMLPVAQWVKQNYGIDVLGSFSITKVCPNGVIFGSYKTHSGADYIYMNWYIVPAGM